MRKSGESGVVLIHVMMLALILSVLATGMLKIIFADHMMVAKVHHSDRNRYWVESCLNQKYQLWLSAGSCSSGSCNFNAAGGPIVNVTCSGKTVGYSVTW